MSRRRNAENVEEQIDTRKTEMPPGCFQPELCYASGIPVLGTEAPKHMTTPSSVAETVQSVAEKFDLNEDQQMVYHIVAEKFINQNILKVDNGEKPLRMLMTGPGGKHIIRFLGPTGTSAKQVGGMTIHKGLGISVSLKPSGHSNRKA